MKSIIIYYSYTGNTQKVADVLTGYLRQKGEAETIEIRGLDESNKFLGQASRALRHKRAEIAPADFNLSKYDLIAFGTPVWAFGPAPAMNTYLDKCCGLEGKSVILFSTYGSGAGNQRCLDYMQGLLSSKGVKKFQTFSIQQAKVNDKDGVFSRIEEILSL